MKIAVIGGDGTGPEVTREALKVLEAVSKMDGFTYELNHLDWGSERYLKSGEIIPPGGVELLQQHDAIFLGAVGHPDVTPGVIEKRPALGIAVPIGPVHQPAPRQVISRCRNTHWPANHRKTLIL